MKRDLKCVGVGFVFFFFKYSAQKSLQVARKNCVDMASGSKALERDHVCSLREEMD